MTAKITASADGTYGSLGVGATEAFRFGSDNSGQLVGFRNRIINGGCQVAQRGAVAVTNGTLVYGGCDRIPVFVSATTASGTISQGGTAGNTSFSTTGLLQGVTVTTTGTGIVQFRQRIESANTVGLNGKAITISVKSMHNVGSAQTLFIAVYKANAADNFSATTLLGTSAGTSVASGLAATTASTYTLTLGASDATNGLEIICFYLNLPTLTSVQFYIGDFQVELGSIATPFEQRPYGLELSLCQRYYETGAIPSYYIPGLTSTTLYLPCSYKVPKRIVNSAGIGLSSSTGAGYTSVGGAATLTTWAPSGATLDGFFVQLSSASALGGITSTNTFYSSAEL